MSDKQIEILNANDYEVYKSINYIRYKKNDYPIAFIDYNKDTKLFSLNILNSIFTNQKDILNAEQEINRAFALIKQLNSI